jgi:transcriptional regulator GlxA family with amidase domain
MSSYGTMEPMESMESMKTIGIFLFDDVEELDAVGPWEVLANWTQNSPEDGWQVVNFSRALPEVRCAKGLTIRADFDWNTVPPLDVLVFPGGQGTRKLLDDPTVLDWVRQLRGDETLMTSVCTGSLVYAAAGILAGRAATTYWNALDLLAQLDPAIDVRRNDRWVDSGEVITASGVSAGIDMALHLVRRLAGDERARQVRRAIQYDPAPPV